MIREFQDSVGFQLIEVVNTEMLLIRFDSPMQLIQMKLMKISHHTVPGIDSETIHDFS
jgi:hypothetical protein